MRPASGFEPSAGLAIDSRSLDALGRRATRDPLGATREAARQFEALFMQEILKSMRRASAASVGTSSQEASMGAQMLDAQWAQVLAGRPGGLADVIERQLRRHTAGSSSSTVGPAEAQARRGPDAAKATVALPSAQRAATATVPSASPAQEFVRRHAPLAREAEQRTGIPAAFMMAQAALETGWGRRELRHADGSPAHNLFGIKADGRWTGPVCEAVTTEYIDGQPRKVVKRFRAYAHPAEAFADYARLLSRSPRYRPVIEAAGDAQGFAQGLQRAGYATDPAYADKLSRVINTTLRLQRHWT